MSEQVILIAEDETNIRQAVAESLRASGYAVLEAENGRQALELLLSQTVDIALLDVNMPEVNGFKVLEIMRKEYIGIPAIMLTARGEEADRIRGLDLGADDYVVKPFSIKELIARVQAVLRRSPARPVLLSEIKIPGGTLDSNTRSIQFDDGHSISLSAKESELLMYLARHPGRVISHDELLQRIWGVDTRAVETRTLQVTMARLRERLGSESPTANALETLRGKGYRWKA